jgi:hypothetical protein
VLNIALAKLSVRFLRKIFELLVTNQGIKHCAFDDDIEHPDREDDATDYQRPVRYEVKHFIHWGAIIPLNVKGSPPFRWWPIQAGFA